jgi:hypothetical protein
MPDPSKRDLLCRVGSDLLGAHHAAKELRVVDRTAYQGVDPDPAPGELDRQIARENLDGAFGSGVGTGPGPPHASWSLSR